MIYLAGQVGIAVFAITGVLAAAHRNLDVFSVLVIGVVTAVGGGTLRDVVLGAPVFWLNDFTSIWTAVAASIATFLLEGRLRNTYTVLLYLDGLACALFAVLAIHKTLGLGFGTPVAVIMGIVTGIGGGLVRDMLIGQPSLLLRREFYSTPILVGGLLFAALYEWLPQVRAFTGVLSATAIFAFRAAAIRYHLGYPDWLTVRSKT